MTTSCIYCHSDSSPGLLLWHSMKHSITDRLFSGEESSEDPKEGRRLPVIPDTFLMFWSRKSRSNLYEMVKSRTLVETRSQINRSFDLEGDCSWGWKWFVISQRRFWRRVDPEKELDGRNRTFWVQIVFFLGRFVQIVLRGVRIQISSRRNSKR